MKNILDLISNNKIPIIIVIILGIIKLLTQNLLLAENGDTYSIFKIAYSIDTLGEIPIWAKRMPFLPFLLSLFESSYYIMVGRLIINLFYLASIFFFYKLIYILLNNNHRVTISICATLVFAANYTIFTNSYYILNDTIFLFFIISSFYEYYTRKRWWMLTILTSLAFYTRIEGILLIGIYGLSYLINKNYKEMLLLGITTSVLISPYFIRNLLLFETLTYSGYLDDQAGFLFSTERIHLTIGNFLFGLGGIWLVPLIIQFYDFNKTRKMRVNYAAILRLLSNPILMSLILFSLLLFAWGQFIRLYSMIFAIIIIYLYKFIQKRSLVPSNRLFSSAISWSIIVATILFSYYYYLVEILEYKDLSYNKYSSVIAVLTSILIILVPILSKIISLNFKKYICIITSLILIINFTIFTCGFWYTRFKYYTIVQATELYNKELSEQGLLTYSNETGVNNWIINDLNETNNHHKYQDIALTEWLQRYKFILVTDEDGVNTELERFVKANKSNFEEIASFESRFFSGSTKIYKNIKYLNINNGN